MAADRLPEDPRGRASHKSIVPGRGGESSRLLSVSEAGGGERGRDGIGRRNSEASCGDAGLWLSADHGGAAARGLGGESQTSAAADARGQFAVFAAASVCAHHGLGPPVAGVSQPGAGTEGERLESALGGRYYLHSAVGGVCVPGSDSGCVLAPGCRLGPAPHARARAGACSVADGARLRSGGWCIIQIRECSTLAVITSSCSLSMAFASA